MDDIYYAEILCSGTEREVRWVMASGKVFAFLVRGMFEDLARKPDLSDVKPGYVEALAASLCATIEAEKRTMLEKMKTVNP